MSELSDRNMWVESVSGTRVTHPAGQDPDMTIAEWIEFLYEMESEYGEDAYLYVNAGHNNAQLMVSKVPPNIGTGRSR